MDQHRNTEALLEELLRQNEHLQLALSVAAAISWEWNHETQENIASEDFPGYFGVSAESFAELRWEAIVHPDDRERLREVQRNMRLSDQDITLEFRGTDQPGGPRRYAMRGKVRPNANGKGLRTIGVTWDVTERNRMREEHALLEQHVQEGQKSESLGVLAGGIAHDFNNILLAVLGNANLARLAAGSNPTVLHHVAQIEEGACRAADLCKQLLAYAGKGRFVLDPTDINRLVDETVHLLKVSIHKKAALQVNLSADLPSVIADSTQLRQVLMNLVINASDATRREGGVISVATGLIQADRAYLRSALLSEDLREGDYVFLEITDTGEGMSAETQARIFEPFFTTKVSGRGLGMSAVLGIVRGHKGALKLQSTLGEGTCFRLLLPALYEVPTQTRLVPRGLSQIGMGQTVLVVDDEASVRGVTTQMLKALGFRPVTASDGPEALQVSAQQRQTLSCVIMDIAMPSVDGAETLLELRRSFPALPVLLMSAYSEQEARDRFTSDSRSHFIQKPFALSELSDKLQTLLQV